MVKTFNVLNSVVLKKISQELFLFQGTIAIKGHELECVYLSGSPLDECEIKAIAYTESAAYLAVSRENESLDSETIRSLGYKIHEKINWDHLLHRPQTFLSKNRFVHYSMLELDCIMPLTLNIGNKCSAITSSSFWIILNNYYDSSIYGDDTDECNIVYIFYRRLSKDVFPDSDAFAVLPTKDIRILIWDEFYLKHKETIENMVIYAYGYETYGFFAGIGGEYSVMEYTFDDYIRPDGYDVIKLKDYWKYVQLEDRETFKKHSESIKLGFKTKHFCESINPDKPEVYYDYDELVARRKEVRDDSLISGQYYSKVVEESFDGINILDSLCVSGDLHLGRFSHDLSGVKEEIDDFWKQNQCCSEYLLLLGDIIDAEYLSEEDLIEANRYFMGFAPKNTYLVLGNNDLLSEEQYLECGYRKVFVSITYGRFLFTHMPVPCDPYIINFHAHLHGRTKYINIKPFLHYDLGYKSCGNRIIVLKEYVNIERKAKTTQYLDITTLFDDRTLELYSKYKQFYYLSDCMIRKDR